MKLLTIEHSSMKIDFPFWEAQSLPLKESLRAMFAEIPLTVHEMRIHPPSNVPLIGFSFLNELIDSLAYFLSNDEDIEFIASLFRQLHPGVRNISFMNAPFHLLPFRQLALMKNSLPFIETVEVPAMVINKMSQHAITCFSEIFPNATYYRLSNSVNSFDDLTILDPVPLDKLFMSTPKLRYLQQTPERRMQHTFDALQLLMKLAQRKQLSVDCVYYIMTFLPLWHEIDWVEKREHIVNASSFQDVLKKENFLTYVPVTWFPPFEAVDWLAIFVRHAWLLLYWVLLNSAPHRSLLERLKNEVFWMFIVLNLVFLLYFIDSLCSINSFYGQIITPFEQVILASTSFMEQSRSIVGDIKSTYQKKGLSFFSKTEALPSTKTQTEPTLQASL